MTALSRRLKIALALYLIPALCYTAIVMLYHRQRFQWFYAGRYSGVSSLLPIAVPMIIAAGVAAVYATALRALQRHRLRLLVVRIREWRRADWRCAADGPLSVIGGRTRVDIQLCHY